MGWSAVRDVAKHQVNVMGEKTETTFTNASLKLILSLNSDDRRLVRIDRLKEPSDSRVPLLRKHSDDAWYSEETIRS